MLAQSQWRSGQCSSEQWGLQLTSLLFTGRGGAGQLLQVTGVFTDGVVVGVVDDPQLSHDVTPDGGLDSPVVDVTLLFVSRQLLHINDLGAQPVQDDPDVLDAEMMFLVDRELVDQEEKLATGGTVALLALKTVRLRVRHSDRRLMVFSLCFADQTDSLDRKIGRTGLDWAGERKEQFN